MTKFTKFIVALIIFVAISQAVKFGMREYNRYSNDAAVRSDIIKGLEDLKKDLPLKGGDDLTTITDMRVENDVVIYEALNEFFDEVADFTKIAKSQFISQLFFVCQNEMTNLLIKNGFAIEYQYVSSKKTKLFTNRITPNDCKLFSNENAAKLVNFYVESQRALLPMPLPGGLALTHVKQKNNLIEFVYAIVDMHISEVDMVLAKEFFDNLTIQQRCSSPDTKTLMEMGIDIIYTYTDEEGSEIYSTQTDISKCNSL